MISTKSGEQGDGVPGEQWISEIRAFLNGGCGRGMGYIH